MRSHLYIDQVILDDSLKYFSNRCRFQHSKFLYHHVKLEATTCSGFRKM